jgi:hypothetical protein
MPIFVALIHGVNFLIKEADTTEPILKGFYVNAYVDTPTPEEAEIQAIELVRTSTKLRPTVANSIDDPPRMSVEDMSVMDAWPDDRALPLSGFVFYDDPNAEWRKDSTTG